MDSVFSSYIIGVHWIRHKINVDAIPDKLLNQYLVVLHNYYIIHRSVYQQ